MCTRPGSATKGPWASSWALVPLLALLRALGGSEPALAAPAFLPPVGIPVGIEPAFVAIAELNGDGRSDLAVANHGSHSVSVLLGRGDGTFAAGATIGVGSWPTWIAAGDLDGDGRADLAVANNQSQTLSILLGRGDGTFTPGVELATTGHPSSVAIADLDGDGRADLAVSNEIWGYPTSTLSLHFGRGDGTFVAGGERAIAGYHASSVAVGDVSGDGLPDLAVTCTFGAVLTVLAGQGDGSFEVVESLTRIGAYGRSVVISDLNGDGHADVTLANALTGSGYSDGDHPPPCWFPCRSEGRVTVFIGSSLEAGAVFATADLSPWSLAVADLDADGRLDLAVTNYNSATVSVHPGDGQGGFGPRTEFSTGASPSSVAISDLNGDGWPDLVTSNAESNDVSILLASPPPVAVRLALTPRALNLASRAHTVTACLEPPAPFAAGDIDIASIRLGGTVPVDPSSPSLLGDRDGDGVPDLSVRFDLTALEGSLAEGAEVAVTVTGRIGNRSFSATDHVRVQLPRGSARSLAFTSADERLPLALDVRLASANPSPDGRLRVELTLPDGRPARLELVDVAGRVLSARWLESAGRGRHTMEVSSGVALPPGVYFVRLSQGATEVVARTAVMR